MLNPALRHIRDTLAGRLEAIKAANRPGQERITARLEAKIAELDKRIADK